MTPTQLNSIAQPITAKYATQDRRRTKHIEHSKARRADRRAARAKGGAE